MMRPVPSTRIVPSGKSTTGASAVPPQRHPAANFGTLASVSSARHSSADFGTLAFTLSSSAMLPLIFRAILNPKRPGRGPSRLDVCEIERVQLRPENVALVAQSRDSAILLGTRSRMIKHILQRERRVLRSFRKPRLKIVEPGSKPRIVLAQLLHAQRNQVAGKKFG